MDRVDEDRRTLAIGRVTRGSVTQLSLVRQPTHSWLTLPGRAWGRKV
jgi:hypothetical protein